MILHCVHRYKEAARHMKVMKVDIAGELPLAILDAYLSKFVCECVQK